MEIRPIRTEADHRAALEEIERLWESKPRTPRGDRLDVLTTLVEAYEEKHHAILPPDPVEAIFFRMEQLGRSRKDLEPLVGSRARVAEILKRKRSLSLQMIRRLHDAWEIPAEVLIQPVRRNAPAVKRNPVASRRR